MGRAVRIARRGRRSASGRDRRLATVAGAARRGQPHAHNVDTPVFAGPQLLLQRAVTLELPVVVGEHAGYGHACHLVEIALQEHPAVGLARPNEDCEVVLVQRLHRWDRFDIEPLLDRRFAGHSVDDDRYLDHAPQRPLHKDGSNADQAQHQAGDGDPPGATFRALQHHRPVYLPRAVGTEVS